MLSTFAFAAATAAVTPCAGVTTVEVNACLSARFTESDAELNRYYERAVERVRKESGSKTAQGLAKAEQSWIAYRDAECRSVFDYWSEGTIRVSMELDCRIRLTRLRTYAIWRDWLTYLDSTSPLLPRPEVESAVTSR